MPKRTKLPKIDYSGGTLYNKALIQKANPLLKLELSLPELKILDVYLSRIDSHHHNKRTVAFEKGELEQYLGVTRILKNDLDKRLRNLFQVVEVEDKTKKRGFKLISLFEEAEAEQDENGLWKITLTCTPSAKEYIFNIEKIGYFRYLLPEVLNFTSRYSYFLFLYLKRFSNFATWEIDLSELKKLLKCENADTYSQYYRFNDLVLKKCFQEINEKTSLKYSYEPIKKGRSVVAVRFTVATLPKLCIENINDAECNLEQITFAKNNLPDREAICHGFSHKVFDDFSDDKLQTLKELAWNLKRDEAVNRHNELIHDYSQACEYATADYLREKILTAKARNPKNLYAYVTKILENERKKK